MKRTRAFLLLLSAQLAAAGILMAVPSANTLVDRKRYRLLWCCLVLAAFLVGLWPVFGMAQAINVDLGSRTGSPASDYGAAGTVGTWNTIGLGTSGLVDLTGSATSVFVEVDTESVSSSVSGSPGDDFALLGDSVFDCVSPETWSLSFSGLQDGSYRILIYGPSSDEVESGDMIVNGVVFPWPLPGEPGGTLSHGFSYVSARATVSGGTLVITGTGDAGAPCAGLAGVQIAAPDAHLDPSFGSDAGIARTGGGPSIYHISGLALQTDGKILVGGIDFDPPGLGLNYHFLRRLHADGSPDLGFQSELAPAGVSYLPGPTTTPPFSPGLFGLSLGVLSNGRIVMAARSELVDFLTWASSDGSANLGGGDLCELVICLTHQIFTAASPESPVDMVVLPNDSFLVAGYWEATAEHYIELIPSLGGPPPFDTRSGVWTSYSAGVALALQDDEKILLAGYDASVNQNFVMRLNATGVIDPSFGTAGLAYTGITGGLLSDVDVAVAPDGGIVLAARDSAGGETFVARFDATGALDPSFGSGGIAKTGVFSIDTVGMSVATLADGKILLAAHDYFWAQMFLARFDATGALDSSFGDQGLWHTGFYVSSSSSSDIVVQPDGKVLLAGIDASPTAHFVARFLKFSLIFADGFEAGDLGAWSSSVE